MAPDSVTETFVALQLFIDNWRWQDVPFFIRTGKRLPVRLSEACIQFKPVPHRSFPPTAVKAWEPNRLTWYITPEEGIRLHFLAKRPGPEMHLDPVFMRFSYREFFRTPPPDAYETLLLDVIRGDASLFMRADQAETAWTVVQSILEGWEAERPSDFPNYAAGQWGPAAADELLARGPALAAARKWARRTPPVTLGLRRARGRLRASRWPGPRLSGASGKPGGRLRSPGQSERRIRPDESAPAPAAARSRTSIRPARACARRTRPPVPQPRTGRYWSPRRAD